MNTDPLSHISSAINTPVANSTVQTDKSAEQFATTTQKETDEITDTLETSDREGDGRMPYETKVSDPEQESGLKKQSEINGRNPPNERGLDFLA